MSAGFFNFNGIRFRAVIKTYATTGTTLSNIFSRLDSLTIQIITDPQTLRRAGIDTTLTSLTFTGIYYRPRFAGAE